MKKRIKTIYISISIKLTNGVKIEEEFHISDYAMFGYLELCLFKVVQSIRYRTWGIDYTYALINTTLNDTIEYINYYNKKHKL